MIMTKILVTILLTVTVAMASAATEHHRIPLESSFMKYQDIISAGWTIDHATTTTMIPMYFALKQPGAKELERVFWDVSDPNSPAYGRHRSIDEITAIIGTTTACQRSVTQWLQPYKPTFTANNDMVFVDMSVADVEALLDVSIEFYRHSLYHSNPVPLASGVYTVPLEISECLDLVGGVTRLPSIRRRRRRPTFPPPQTTATSSSSSLRPQRLGDWPDNDCTVCLRGEVSPNIIKTRYNVTAATYVAGTNTSMAIVNADSPDAYFTPSDLKDFFKGCGLPSKDAVVSKVFGTNDEGKCSDVNNCLEASGDIQVSKAVSPEIPLQVWITSGDYLKWSTKLATTADAALVHSTSAGDPELQPYAGSKEFQQRTSVELQKCGVRGMSILFSSGDNGVSEIDRKFQPSFPSNTPYVTTVGGTVFSDPTHVQSAENGWNGSGGGFSWYFDRPSYQNAAVDAYFASGVEFPGSEYFNKGGRGVPDVALLAGQPDPNDICMLRNSRPQQFAGTSASSPMFAGMVARLNSIRLSRGKSPMGFLNPWLYGVARNASDAFFDVLVGYNPTQPNEANAENKGFHATRGWDGVTGLGSPNLHVLSQLV